MSIADRLRKPTVQGRYLRWVIYGPNRVGKSVLAGSAAAILPTLFVEVDEGGSDSLIAFGYEPDVIRITGIKDLNDIFWGLREGTLVSKVQPGRPFQVAIFDGATELAKRAMDTILELGPEKLRPQTGFLDSTKFPQKREWGITTEQMRKVIRYFNDLPIHLIWTAQDRTFTDPVSGAAIRIGPALNPALSDDLCNYSKIISYMYAKAGKEDGVIHRYLILGPADLNGVPVVAGHRMGLPEDVTYMIDPTFQDIYDLILTEQDFERKGVSPKTTEAREIEAPRRVLKRRST